MLFIYRRDVGQYFNLNQFYPITVMILFMYTIFGSIAHYSTGVEIQRGPFSCSVRLDPSLLPFLRFSLDQLWFSSNQDVIRGIGVLYFISLLPFFKLCIKLK